VKPNRYDLILAAEIGADNEVCGSRRLALELLVGKPAAEPKPLARPVVLPAIPLTDEPIGSLKPRSQSHTAQARLGVDVAKLGTAKAYAGNKPTLDLTASYGNNRYPGGNSTSGFYTRTTSGTVGVA
jgi:outer membrane protein